MMEHQYKTVDTAVLLEEYRRLLPQVESLPLRISGSSMAPFLVDGRDTVWLSAIRSPLRVGEIVLYRRDNGSYILHRICRKQDGKFWIIGDAHHVIEKGVREDQIFARVCQVERRGKILKPGCFWWMFFEKIWIRLIPLRPLLLRLAAGYHRTRRKERESFQ